MLHCWFVDYGEIFFLFPDNMWKKVEILCTVIKIDCLLKLRC